jgi:putative phosphoesterase
MKVGLISDVHANLPALETVLDDMPSVDRIVCAGDVIGYNPWPAECVERVREVAAMTVRGNHDRTVETPEKYRANRMAEAGLEHAKATLSDDQRAWLDGLPRAETFAGDRYLLVHSHPAADREDAYVYPEEFPNLDRHMGEYDGIVLGHTHVQGKRSVAGGVVVNPGSVGQPRDGDPDAGYAVLHTQTDEVDLHRVAYDIDRVSEAVADAGLPERTAARLYKGE